MVLIILLDSAGSALAAPFDGSGWPTIGKEEFTTAPLAHKTAWIQRLTPDSPLESPKNTRALEILTWALQDQDPEFRKKAARSAVLYLTKLRNHHRGKKVPQFPIKREVIAELLAAIKANFESPDVLVRSDAVLSHLWIRGSGSDCADVALPLMKELSVDVTEQWGRREAILNLMTHTGCKAPELPLSYPHPNSRKSGEPLTGTKLIPYNYKAGDITWTDFLENSLP